MNTFTFRKLLLKFVSSLFIVILVLTALGVSPIVPVMAATAGGPPNDDFDSAIDITGNLSSPPFMYSVLEGTTAATVASDDPWIPACDENFGASTVWFKFKAPSTGLITIDTTNSESSYDSIIALWTGTRGRGNLNLVGCNDDAPSTTNTVRAKLTSWVMKDVWYYIEVVTNNGNYKPSPTADEMQILLGTIKGGALGLSVSLSSIQPMSNTWVDNPNPALKYTGNWINYSGAGPVGNTLYYSDDPFNGNSVDFVFDGTQFSLIYTQFTNRGYFDVYIDGKQWPRTITLTDTTDPKYACIMGSQYVRICEMGPLKWQQYFSGPVLPQGIHYVSLKHASFGVVDIDYLNASAPQEWPANPPNVVTLSASSGTAAGTVNVSFNAPGEDSSPTPVGTAASYQFRFSSSPILTKADWDAANVYQASVIVPAPVNTPQIATLSGFTPGSFYYFAMIAVDDSGNASGISSTTTSTMAQILQPLGPGTYDDSNPAWSFVGNWTSFNGAGPYAGTLHYAGTLGNSAEVQITGQQFILTYSGYFNRGEVDVYLDAATTPLDTFTQYDSVLSWQKTYQSPAFSAGTHLVRLVNKTPGAYVDIDAITVLATPDSTAPAAITNLATVITNATPIGGITLTWAAPGSDGWFGRAASYEVRYSFAPITDQASWDNATLVTTGVPLPAVAGTTQTVAITGLFPSTDYYFAVRTKDVSNNQSSISNTPFAKPKTPTPVGAGFYDDANAAWIYAGSGWQAVGASGPYNNTLHYSGTLNDSAQFTFTGPQFTLYYTTYTNRGAYDVYVDGKKIDTFNANGTLLYQQQYTSPLLDIGVHTVRFVNATPGAYIDIDAIRIASAVSAGIVDDTNAAWVFGGSGWQSVSAAGPYNNTLRYSGTLNDFAQIIFTGPQFTLYYSVFTNRGDYDVYVDGNKIDTFNANGALLWQQQYTSPVLSNGLHVARFVNATPGAYIDIDAIRIAKVVGAGTTDDADAAWMYSGGGWLTFSGSGPYNNTLHYSNAINDFAEILIAGPQFTLFYTRYSNRGVTDVYVDGGKVGSFDASNSVVVWQQPYTYSGLSNTIHRVRFVHVAGAFTDIDAIRVEPMPLLPGTYDDSYGSLLYTGNWLTFTGAGPYGNTLRYAGDLEAALSFKFEGSQFRILYTGYTNRGSFDVYIDGALQTTKLNEFNSPLVWQMTYASPVLTPGLHDVILVHRAGPYVDVDAVTILP